MWRRTLARAVLAGLALVAFSSMARPAAACGACVCRDRDLDFVDYDVSMYDDLPRNPQFFARLTPTSSVRLVRVSDGVEIPVELVPAGGNIGATWIRPTELLDTGEVYQAEVDDLALVHYEAGTYVDETAPSEIVATIEHPTGTSSCDAFRGAQLVVKSIVDETITSVAIALDVTGPGGTERLWFRSRTGSFGESFPFGVVTGGETGCAVGQTMQSAELGVSYTAKLTAYDAAGNATSYGLPAFTLSDLGPASCGGGEAPPGSGGQGASGGGGSPAAGGGSGGGGSPAAGGASSGGEAASGCAAAPGSSTGLPLAPTLALLALARLTRRRRG